MEGMRKINFEPMEKHKRQRGVKLKIPNKTIKSLNKEKLSSLYHVRIDS